MTFSGVVITVVAAGVSSALSLSGYVALAIAVVSYALYSVFVDKVSGFSEIEITYAMLSGGSFLFVLLSYRWATLLISY